MPGPMPLPDHERQRRNLDARFTTVSEGKRDRKGAFNPLVNGLKRAEYRGWSALAKDMWRAILSDPVSSMYGETEWIAARLLCRLLSSDRVTDADRALALMRELCLTTSSKRRARIDSLLPAREPREPRPVVDYRKMFEGEEMHKPLPSDDFEEYYAEMAYGKEG